MKTMISNLVSMSLALGLCATLANAAENSGITENGLVIERINYDGEIPMRWMGTLKATDRYNEYSNFSRISCAQIDFTTDYNQWSWEDQKSFGCEAAVLSFDLVHRELIMMIDMIDVGFWHEHNPQAIPEGTYRVARYAAGISGTAIDYFAQLRSQMTPTGDARIDSLAAALTAIGGGNQTFSQERFTEGKLVIKAKGPLKVDPLGFRQVPAPAGARVTHRLSLDVKDREMEIKSPGALIDRYPSTEKLTAAMSQTRALLEQGYDNLHVNSDEENQRLFRELIKDNAPVIAGELRQVLSLMRTENFHIMELVHFLNGFAGLVDAIDVILKNGVGTEPGMLKILMAH